MNDNRKTDNQSEIISGPEAERQIRIATNMMIGAVGQFSNIAEISVYEAKTQFLDILISHLLTIDSTLATRYISAATRHLAMQSDGNTGNECSAYQATTSDRIKAFDALLSAHDLFHAAPQNQRPN